MPPNVGDILVLLVAGFLLNLITPFLVSDWWISLGVLYIAYGLYLAYVVVSYGIVMVNSTLAIYVKTSPYYARS